MIGRLFSMMFSVTSSERGSLQPFETLFDQPAATPSLPEAFQQVYGGDWPVEWPRRRPYTYSNFVVSRDGRVSFNLPGRAGGGEVSGFNAHDQWLMGLLRARANAVLVGDVTLRVEPEHLWTSQFICPTEANGWASLRAHWGLAPYPLQVFLSLEGDLNPDAAIWQHPELRVVVATAARGRERLRDLTVHLTSGIRVDAPDVGGDSVNLESLTHLLRADYGVTALLCEGGPRVYGSMVAARLMDEEFLTLSPIVIGQDVTRSRPGLIEGAPFTPETAPRSRPISLKRAGDYLFLRSRLEYS